MPAVGRLWPSDDDGDGEHGEHICGCAPAGDDDDDDNDDDGDDEHGEYVCRFLTRR